MNTDEFWGKVDQAEGCWPWLGHIGRGGYGRAYFQGRNQRAHRIAYELTIGPIPAGLTLDHLCRNRACVNPAHLEPVTIAENIARGVGPGQRRVTHCPQGHAYDAENTYHWRGHRKCKECMRAKCRRQYRERQARIPGR